MSNGDQSARWVAGMNPAMTGLEEFAIISAKKPMAENKKSARREWRDPDDAPDLSTPEWRERFARAQMVLSPIPSFQRKPGPTVNTVRILEESLH
jgi:hypothetical protein